MNATQMRIMGCETQTALDELAAEIEGFKQVSARGLQKLRDSVALRRADIIRAGKKGPGQPELTPAAKVEIAHAVRRRSAKSRKAQPIL